MELEDLKYLWKKSEPGFRPKGEAEIASMLKGNSNSIVIKLKRSVWFELIFTVVAGIGLLIYALMLPPGALKWTSVSVLVILVLYSGYYIKKLMLLNQFDPAQDNIRANLEHLITNLSNYLKFYKRSYTILYPVYFVLGLIFGAIERGTTHFLDSLTKPKTIIILLVVAIIFFFASTSLVNWLLKKLYGNHLEKLKALLRDLTQQES
jgi:uncharacterized membrane protein